MKKERVDKKECPECGNNFGPKPYNKATGSTAMNYHNFNKKVYCSESCKNTAIARKTARKNAVWARYKRMCRVRVEAAFNLFVYGKVA